MFKKKILIIDDLVLIRTLTSDILTEKGYEVVTASNGREGINAVYEEKPDLVLLDIIMPEMDGFEVCRILRADESNNLMPIIILTAQDDEEDKLHGLELGADDYIIKPFNPRELISRVNNTLKRIDRNRWANPLTGLQGNMEVQMEINHRLAKGMKFAFTYLDLDNFKAYNDVYGFVCGDRAIKMTADIIVDNVHAYGAQGDFIGHIGGDDFIIITGTDTLDPICEGIIRDFDEKIPTMYSAQDREQGYITTESRKGTITKYPIMSISIAATSNEQRKFSNHIEVAETTTELKKHAKLTVGSVFVKDRRRQDYEGE